MIASFCYFVSLCSFFLIHIQLEGTVKVRVGLIVIGDEIMSGKRKDSHFPAVVEMLEKRGIRLDWAVYLADDPEKITEVLTESFRTDDIVFSCGGIGGTPDDHTRRCVAAALNVPLVLHPEAKEKINERTRDLAIEQGIAVDFSAPESVRRLRLGELPEGAGIIPNPVNKVPGFFVGTHYFLPGFPEMAHPMMEWVLETFHQAEFHRADLSEKELVVYEIPEARITPVMEEVEREFDQVRIFSLPHLAKEGRRSFIELGVRGEAAQVEAAFEKIKSELRHLNIEFEIN